MARPPPRPCVTIRRTSALDDRPAARAAARGRGCPAPPRRAEPPGRLVERHPPVDADHVSARTDRIGPQQLAGADAEVDARDPGLGQRLEDGSAVRQHEPLVVGRATAIRPTSRTAAPPRHRRRSAPEGTRRAITASRPSSACQSPGSACISALVRAWSRDGPPSIEVAGQGERRTGEADQRGLAQLADQGPHRLADVGDVGRIELAQHVRGRRRPDRASRPPARHRRRCRRRPRSRPAAPRCRRTGSRRRRRAGAPAAA